MKDDKYQLQIDSFTPETLPMARLAQYMAELAGLLGNEQSVHFRELKRGSAVLVSSVDPVAVPKVRERLTRVDVSTVVHKPTIATEDDVVPRFRKLNKMLADDNAVGRLRRGTALILKFPGREQARTKIGPITQQTTLVGQLVRIGGRDHTAHAQIEDAEGRTWKMILSRDQARQLASFLYGSPIQVHGPGRWIRSESGAWELEEMRLSQWAAVGTATLRETVGALRQIEGAAWKDLSDPAGALALIRGSDEGVH